MDLKLAGKKAVVMGGSRGIGKAVARQLAEEGCDLAICARSEGPLRETADEIAKATGRKVYAATCDTMDPAAIKRFIASAAQELGGIDILINSAARVGGAPGTVETIDENEVLRDFEEKVVGYLRSSREVVKYMKEKGWGRIINISGAAGRAPGVNISGGARNSATVVLTKATANALGQYGITANAIYPGITLTEATLEQHRERAEREGKTVEAIIDELASRTPIRHLINADEVAHVIVFLCSPLALGITGEAIAVNGGNSTDVHF